MTTPWPCSTGRSDYSAYLAIPPLIMRLSCDMLIMYGCKSCPYLGFALKWFYVWLPYEVPCRLKAFWYEMWFPMGISASISLLYLKVTVITLVMGYHRFNVPNMQTHTVECWLDSSTTSQSPVHLVWSSCICTVRTCVEVWQSTYVYCTPSYSVYSTAVYAVYVDTCCVYSTGTYMLCIQYRYVRTCCVYSTGTYMLCIQYRYVRTYCVYSTGTYVRTCCVYSTGTYMLCIQYRNVRTCCVYSMDMCNS